MRNGSLRVVGVAAVLLLGGCGPSGAGEDGDGGEITVYSGRDEEFIGPLYDRFEETSGVEIDVRYGDSAELAAQILEEGGNSPADVFVSQDAGSLGAVAEEGLLEEIDEDLLERVDDRFRSRDGAWVGISGRARVAAYNTEALGAGDLPDSVLGFTAPEWKGRIGFPPTNSSFQAFVAAMIVTEGRDRTRSFLEGLQANEPRLYEDNDSTTRAVAAGEIDVGLVNHYYIYEVAAEDGDIPVANHFFRDGDPGALVNVAGVGILETSDEPDAVTKLVEFLTGEEGQRYFAEETLEYPVVPGVRPSSDLVPLGDIRGPELDLSDLGGAIEPALALLSEVGLL